MNKYTYCIIIRIQIIKIRCEVFTPYPPPQVFDSLYPAVSVRKRILSTAANIFISNPETQHSLSAISFICQVSKKNFHPKLKGRNASTKNITAYIEMSYILDFLVEVLTRLVDGARTSGGSEAKASPAVNQLAFCLQSLDDSSLKIKVIFKFCCTLCGEDPKLGNSDFDGMFEKMKEMLKKLIESESGKEIKSLCEQIRDILISFFKTELPAVKKAAKAKKRKSLLSAGSPRRKPGKRKLSP
eukprot:1344545-Amorphochlora_amoeboformis.AAC.1